MKINKFQSDVTDISAKKEALLSVIVFVWANVSVSSASFWAKMAAFVDISRPCVETNNGHSTP